MKSIARKRGGKCISKSYKNAHFKLNWQCEYGHTWRAQPANILRGQWCPICAYNRKRLKLRGLKSFAKRKGGKCFSSNYINSISLLLWECKLGHKWKASANNILRGTWCPICSSGISERICRKHFEILFKHKFPKTKPKWLISSSGSRMELDGYCRRLGIAFEYQGQQHYKPNTYFSPKRSFAAQLRNDREKVRICKLKGIILIDVPYYINIGDMKRFIMKKCREKRITVKTSKKNISINDLEVYSPDVLLELNKIAHSRGGKCLSNKYVNSTYKLKWQCGKGHKWETRPGHIIQGAWCPYCAGRGITIENMQTLAKRKRGSCLSKEYLNPHTKLKWRCKEGHIWEGTPNNIRRGKWCPYCSNNAKLTLKDLKLTARQKNGKCLSKIYINANKKVLWQCKIGHRWMATPGSVRSGTWCPICARKNKL